MDRTEAVLIILRFLTCIDNTNNDCWGECETCRYNTSKEEVEPALKVAVKVLEQAPTFEWLMQKADEWGMAYGKQFLIEAQRVWEGEQYEFFK